MEKTIPLATTEVTQEGFQKNCPAMPELDWDKVVGAKGELFGRLFDNIRRIGEASGPICRFTYFNEPVVFVQSHELAHEILVKNDACFHHTKAPSHNKDKTKSLMGDGMFFSVGADHRRKRRLVAPAFQPRHVSLYATQMAEGIERVQSSWVEGSTLALPREMLRLSLAVIGKTVVGEDILGTDFETAHLALMRFATEMQETTLNKISGLFPWRLRAAYRTAEAMDAVLYPAIARCRASRVERDDVLAVLIQSRHEDGSGMTDDEIRDELMTLMFAGTVHVMEAVSWAWYQLSQHPEILNKLQQEADTVLKGRLPTLADLAALPYALQVFKEGMRLHPRAGRVTRRCKQGVVIGGFTIPAGTLVWMSIHRIHQDERYFPNPTHFNPDRFTPEEEKKRPPTAFMPFGLGPRVCIGNYFALMEGQLILTILAQRTALTLIPQRGKRPETQLTLYPHRGFQMQVRRRDSSHSSPIRPVPEASTASAK